MMVFLVDEDHICSSAMMNDSHLLGTGTTTTTSSSSWATEGGGDLLLLAVNNHSDVVSAVVKLDAVAAATVEQVVSKATLDKVTCSLSVVLECCVVLTPRWTRWPVFCL